MSRGYVHMSAIGARGDGEFIGTIFGQVDIFRHLELALVNQVNGGKPKTEFPERTKETDL